MSPAGRPTSANPKSIDIKVRIDRKMCADLDAYCAEHETTRAAAIRSGIELLLSAGQEKE